MSKLRGIFPPLGLALVLAIGFGTVFGFAAGWGISIWDGLQHQEQVAESLVVRADGTPLIKRQTYDRDQYQYREIETFHALNGGEVPGVKEEDLLSSASLAKPHPDEPEFPLDGYFRVGLFTDAQKPPNLWYFVDDGARDGRGYFVGYQSKSKLRVGFIGRDGFCPDQPPVEQWFPMDGVKLARRTAFCPSHPAETNGAAKATRTLRRFPPGK